MSGEAAPDTRIDPQRSACVLIGVDQYTRLDKLPSVRLNLSRLSAALMKSEIWGIPKERVREVRNPRLATDLTDPIRDAGKLAEDALIVYYAGHGLIDPEGKDGRGLLLTLTGSVDGQKETSVRSADLSAAMKGVGNVRHRILILDCCYSGRMLGEMAGAGKAAEQALKSVQGSYIMASAPSDRPSHSLGPGQCTVFTGALLDVMEKGVPDGLPLLSLDHLFDAVKRHITTLRLQHPQDPQNQDRNNTGSVDFIHNVAVRPPLVTPAPPASPRRTLAWSLAAGALGLTLGLGTQPAVDWLQSHPVPATGSCGNPAAAGEPARAHLLDHSDALDKKNVSYTEVKGLSGLALLPETGTETGTGTSGQDVRALAVADNSPGLLFPLTLGTPTSLGPTVGTPRALRDPNGADLPDWYDAEALVVEKGARTVLIGSESGPTVRRFDIATGRQLGPDFAVPKNLHYWPEGGAQTGRSIESLALSPDGRHLYAGWEAPLASDGDRRGRGIIRIQRYTGTPGGTYTPDAQYAYLAGDGMYLVELAAIDDKGGLLALERQHVGGLGTAIRVVQLSVADAQDVTDEKSLYGLPVDLYADQTALFDLEDCPAGSPGALATPASAPNTPLVDNVEGMALGASWATGPHKGWRPLYLISDDNGSADQITRLYSLRVRLYDKL
ncbi:esterase-like activity of phytase family protein [Streptomyces sp. NPDC004539]|uniref:caspase, EACC1-associated type n=1 Tax=Streptomyces sp. NPDC004539 TaxID=3154280 RepID=UPI00339FBB7C